MPWSLDRQRAWLGHSQPALHTGPWVQGGYCPVCSMSSGGTLSWEPQALVPCDVCGGWAPKEDIGPHLCWAPISEHCLPREFWGGAEPPWALPEVAVSGRNVWHCPGSGPQQG